jgi:hypothetical protein
MLRISALVKNAEFCAHERLICVKTDGAHSPLALFCLTYVSLFVSPLLYGEALVWSTGCSKRRQILTFHLWQHYTSCCLLEILHSLSFWRDMLYTAAHNLTTISCILTVSLDIVQCISIPIFGSELSSPSLQTLWVVCSRLPELFF